MFYPVRHKSIPFVNTIFIQQHKRSIIFYFVRSSLTWTRNIDQIWYIFTTYLNRMFLCLSIFWFNELISKQNEKYWWTFKMHFKEKFKIVFWKVIRNTIPNGFYVEKKMDLFIWAHHFTAWKISFLISDHITWDTW